MWVVNSLLALVSFLPVPQPTPARATAPSEVRFEEGRRSARLPVEIAGAGLVFVKGEVQGKPFWFFLDTSSPSAFGNKQAARLGLAELPAPGTSSPRLQGLRLQFPGLVLSPASVESFDLDPLRMALGHRVDGILGSSFFEKLVVEIDYARRTVKLTDPASYRYEGKGASVPIALEEGRPYVSAELTLAGRRLTGQFLVDTSADRAVALFSPFVRANHLLETPAGKPPDDNLEAIVRAKTLDLAGFRLREPVVLLSRSAQGALADSRHAGLLGVEVLSRFRVVFDAFRRRIILEKSARLSEPFAYDASGVSLAAQGPDLMAFEIRRVAPGSPGDQAGLRIGDVLLAVDRRPASEITLRGIRRLFRQAEKEYTLSVFREGQIRQVRIKCRRLL